MLIILDTYRFLKQQYMPWSNSLLAVQKHFYEKVDDPSQLDRTMVVQLGKGVKDFKKKVEAFLIIENRHSL